MGWKHLEENNKNKKEKADKLREEILNKSYFAKLNKVD
jgi:hypothetical protein